MDPADTHIYAQHDVPTTMSTHVPTSENTTINNNCLESSRVHTIVRHPAPTMDPTYVNIDVPNIPQSLRLHLRQPPRKLVLIRII